MLKTNKWKHNKIWWNAAGRRGEGGGKQKIIWWKFRCKHTKEFQSESLQKVFCKKCESKPVRVAMCVWQSLSFWVCVCVRVYIAEQKKRSAFCSRTLRWHGRRTKTTATQGQQRLLSSSSAALLFFFLSQIRLTAAWRWAIGGTHTHTHTRPDQAP